MRGRDDSLSIYRLYNKECQANPHPFYHMLRTIDPVHWDSISRHWVVTRYIDVTAALHMQQLSAQRMPDVSHWPEQERATLTVMVNAVANQMAFQDLPDHARLRGLVSKAFSPRMVDGMKVRIKQIAVDLLKPLSATGHMEVINDFAYPLPAIVIAEMLGVPTGDRDQFKAWCDDFQAFIGNVALPPTRLVQAQHSTIEMLDYFRHLVAQCRIHPHDNLLTALVYAYEQGCMVSEEEFLSNCILLLTAGHQTSTHMIGNALLALFQHPLQKDQFINTPTLGSSAVQELLRYDGPVQFVSRVAADNLDLAGKSIKKGQRVLLCLAAANRDPEQFPDPDRLDLGRTGGRPIPFSHGIHTCLGASLARLEGEIGLGVLLRHFPQVQLSTRDLHWQETITFRGLTSLHVMR